MKPGPKHWTPQAIAATPEDEVHRQADAAIRKIDRALVGRHPGAQALALMIETAKWIGGHPEELRGDVFRHYVDGVRALMDEAGAAIDKAHRHQ